MIEMKPLKTVLKIEGEWALVAGGRDQEDCGSKPA
jgi:hypothetical protein